MGRSVRMAGAVALLVLAAGCRHARPAPTVVAARPTGTISVACNADSPTITVDDKPAGTGRQGPYTAGPHAVHAVADGYEAETQTVTVQDNADVPVSFTLKRQPGVIEISVNVPADCDVGGDHRSFLPGKPAVFSEPAGLVQVVCKAPGYREASTLVGVKAGHTVNQSVNLAPNIRVESLSGLEFVWLPGGSAHVGCATNDPGCVPKKTNQDQPPPVDNGQSVDVRPMWVGRTEVTEEAYRKCVDAGACEIPRGQKGACNYKGAHRERYPINCITWDQASEFCHWIGGRLPTVNEWQYAARSGRDQIYPWGQQPVSKARANYCDRACRRKKASDDKASGAPVVKEAVHDEEVVVELPPESQSDGFTATAPVGSFPGGATPDGLLDMAGNVEEWTSTETESIATEGERKVSATFHVAAGGSYADEPIDVRVSNTHSYEPKHRSDTLGVRCLLQ